MTINLLAQGNMIGARHVRDERTYWLENKTMSDLPGVDHRVTCPLTARFTHLAWPTKIMTAKIVVLGLDSASASPANNSWMQVPVGHEIVDGKSGGPQDG